MMRTVRSCVFAAALALAVSKAPVSAVTSERAPGGDRSLSSIAEPAPAGPSTSKPATTSGAQQKKKEPRRSVLEGFEVPPPPGPAGTRVTPGATRGGEDEPVTLLAPGLGNLLGVSPLFEWDADGESGPYTLEILDEKGAPAVPREVVQREWHTPSGGADIFKPGQIYSWQVSITTPAGRRRSPRAYFAVPSPDERSGIEKALAALGSDQSYETRLARARLLRDRKFWYDSIGAYSAIIKDHVDRPEPYDERGQIYNQIEGTRPRAERDFQAADTLRSKP